MKKFTALLVALLVAVSAIATLVPVSAEEVDLLAESGYGDYEYLYENGVAVDSGEWSLHPNWQTFQGYLGFISNGYPIEVTATREITQTTLSDGSTGYALHYINDTETECFCNTALENLDILCGGFEEGKTYRVVVVAKIMEGQFNTVPEIKVNSYPGVEMACDSQWHEYEVSFTYDSNDATVDSTRSHENWDSVADGAYKDTYAITLLLGEIGVSYPGTEFFFESIKVFEENNTPTGDSAFLFVTAFVVAISAAVVLLKRKALLSK